MNTCSICLSGIYDNSKILNCNHCYHNDCINLWSIKSNTCPLCREPIEKFIFLMEKYVIGEDGSDDSSDDSSDESSSYEDQVEEDDDYLGYIDYEIDNYTNE